MNNSVQIKPAQDGSIISVYKSNPKFGYIQLTSTEMSIEGGWVREKSRTCLLRAEVPMLEKFIQLNGRTGTVSGRIVIREFQESELPENFQSRLATNVDYEKSIEPFVKRAGKDGIELTVGGERILRFADYDPSGKEHDIIIAHDNVSEVSASRATANSENASFPGA